MRCETCHKTLTPNHSHETPKKVKAPKSQPALFEDDELTKELVEGDA